MVGSYYIGGTLGRGSYAKVMQARNTVTNEKVAIKIMDRKFIERENIIEYVKKEISVMHSLKHPNIVQLKDVLLTTRNIYLVLELITGEELFNKVATKGALDEVTARKYFQQLISAVEYCHAHGVCHRDLKLENVVVDTATGILKILDFGFSRHLDSFLKTPVGTPTYIAPEALSVDPGKNYDGKAVDVWAMGVMLYVMVVGQYPFGDPNSNLGTLYTRIKSAQYTPVPQRISDACRALIAKILQPDPSRRITIEQLKQDPWFIGPPSQPSAAPVAVAPPAPLSFNWPTQEVEEPMETEGGALLNSDDDDMADEEEDDADEDDWWDSGRGGGVGDQKPPPPLVQEMPPAHNGPPRHR